MQTLDCNCACNFFYCVNTNSPRHVYFALVRSLNAEARSSLQIDHLTAGSRHLFLNFGVQRPERRLPTTFILQPPLITSFTLCQWIPHIVVPRPATAIVLQDHTPWRHLRYLNFVDVDGERIVRSLLNEPTKQKALT